MMAFSEVLNQMIVILREYGRGKTVVTSREAGIGKSRWVESLHLHVLQTLRE